MKKKFATLLLAFFSLLIFSCASGPKTERADLFYEENANLFKEAALSNGIPVIIKNIPYEKNIELRVLFWGGASSCPKGKSGLDVFTFDLIGESTQIIKERSARGRYFPLSACLADWSYCGFGSSAEDFFESLGFFSAALFSPQYSRDDYLKKEAAFATQAISRSENPRYELLDEIQKRLYQNSPYFDGIYYKPASRVSEYDIEKNISSLLNANRMAIVAAGNFSYKEQAEKGGKKDAKAGERLFNERAAYLLEQLEKAFGSVQRSAWTAPTVPPVKLGAGGKAALHSEFAGADFYSALCFACPARGSDDYEAFALSTLALDSLLARELVERQKAAAYCGTGALNSRQGAVMILAGGKNGNLDIYELIKESFKGFPVGAELESALGYYKNIYVSRVIGSAQNAGATLDQMASSLFYEGDAKAFLERPKKIRAATPQDVASAFEKYFLAENSLYVLLTN